MNDVWLGILIGFVVAGIVTALLWRRAGLGALRAQEADRQARASELAAMIAQLETSFNALSRSALSANADDFLKLAKTALEQQVAGGERTLEEKKKLIDQRLEEMSAKLSSLNALVETVDKQRAESHGAIQRHLQSNAEATARLQTTTGQLREALANPQRRGQWGERMAEDVLRLAGFIEGVNYTKQETVGDGGRPDFTFPLPGNRLVHMDAKFPLANYLRVLDAADDAARAEATHRFLQDVRNRIREVAKRTYIDPAAGTVDYALVFIANEQIYGFIHEHDATLLDQALRSKVVLCSPLTLYAILAVIRQASESFRVEMNSKQILEHLGEFQKQWKMFVESMEKMGKRLEEARSEFDALKSTRTRMLERQIDKIEDLRSARQGEPGAPTSPNPSQP